MGTCNGDRDIGNPHPGVSQVAGELLVKRRRGWQRRRGVRVCTSPGSANTDGDSAMAVAITSAASVAGRLMAR
jgi:hypothetical protein